MDRDLSGEGLFNWLKDKAKSVGKAVFGGDKKTEPKKTEPKKTHISDTKYPPDYYDYLKSYDPKFKNFQFDTKDLDKWIDLRDGLEHVKKDNATMFRKYIREMKKEFDRFWIGSDGSEDPEQEFTDVFGGKLPASFGQGLNS
jgi:hypothetical protein